MRTRVEMASEKEASRGLEWQVTVPGGSSVRLETDSVHTEAGWRMHRLASALRSKVFDFASKVRKIAADDPRKVVHCMKVGLALALVSVFYYTRPLYDGVGGAAMWAVMTVVVVFEFTVGRCYSNTTCMHARTHSYMQLTVLKYVVHCGAHPREMVCR